MIRFFLEHYIIMLIVGIPLLAFIIAIVTKKANNKKRSKTFSEINSITEKEKETIQRYLQKKERNPKMFGTNFLKKNSKGIRGYPGLYW